MIQTSEITIRDRMNLLKQMDDYLIANVGDDVYCNTWLTCGLEDGGADDPEILRDYAENEEYWLNCVDAFRTCLTIEKEMYE